MNRQPRRTWMLAASVALALSVLGSAPVAGCDAECTEAIGCFGNCSITPPPNCGDLCAGLGCSLICRLIGPNCNEGGSFDCARDYAEEGQQASTEWAVLEYWTDGVNRLLEEDVRTLAASSPWFAGTAPSIQREALNRQLVESGASPGRRTMIYVSPGEREPCVEVEPRLTPQAAELFPAVGASAYIQGWTDERGRVVDVKILHTESQHASDVLPAAIRESLQVRSEAAAPLTFYGYFTVAEGPAPGFIVGGASKLAE